jgi:large subunit ribosomal protein L1
VGREDPAGKQYAIDDALALVKQFATAKFDESIDVAVNLGIDASKSDQQVRGSTVLPHGTGKTVRVAVFTSGKNADAAREPVPTSSVSRTSPRRSRRVNSISTSWSQAPMRCVSSVSSARSSAARPDAEPKVGTVTPDVAGAVRNAKAGQVRFRADKAGVIHCSIGKASFEPARLKENLQALLHDLQRVKPAASKGVFLKRVAVSSTMGPGVPVDQGSLG